MPPGPLFFSLGPARKVQAIVTRAFYNGGMLNFIRIGIVMLAGTILVAAFSGIPGNDAPKQLIAHRGASGYAPEHTFASYDLAIAQKADYVEPDLAVSKDGVLICLHDDTLDRTTNVEEVYPARFSPDVKGRNAENRWVANDFTVAEIRKLDAGSWFDAKFAGAPVPTWDEMLMRVQEHPGVGVYPELKSPPLYTARGIDMAKIFVESVKKHGLDRPESLRNTPVIVQSFDRPTIKRMSVELPSVPRVFLTEEDEDVAEARLKDL